MLAGALALVGCGGSSKGSTTQASAAGSTNATSAAVPTAPATSTAPGVVSESLGSVRASMHAGTHHPVANRPWPVHFAVTQNGQPARASVAYEFVLAGQVVAHRSHYAFDGHFSDIVVWPPSAVGYPLTFRAVIVTGSATLNLDYPVQVIR